MKKESNKYPEGLIKPPAPCRCFYRPCWPIDSGIERQLRAILDAEVAICPMCGQLGEEEARPHSLLSRK